MIAGYNTDVRHGETVFHVQTEDKGASNPFIESLVYVGGRVLAAKRASYASLLAQGKGTQAISELMEGQHRAMIAAIRQGKFDAKVQSLTAGRPAVKPDAATAPPVEPATDSDEVQDDLLAATRITEEERTLDQVILEYLTSESQQEQLCLAVDGEPDLASGLPARVRLRATSSKSGAAVIGAQVDVKLISTVAEARTLASGETDAGGGVQLSFLIPDLGAGTAALIFTAESTLGTAELKHLL
jgi:hypothetical protein